MPWLLLHKCTITQPEPGPYGMAKAYAEDAEQTRVTQVICGLCREILLIGGHEFFENSKPNWSIGKNLPPGFTTTETRRAD